jgi:hypothetical protein
MSPRRRSRHTPYLGESELHSLRPRGHDLGEGGR